MGYLLYGLMIVCAGVMIWANGQSKSKGATWGRPVAGFFGVLAVIFALTQMTVTLTCAGDGVADDIIDREETYLQAQMRYLGEHLGTNHMGAKILLITDPQTEYSAKRITMMREALEKGMSGNASIVAVESPKTPEMSEGGADDEMMMYEYYLTAEVFDEMLNDHPECNMVLSMMGLPYDFSEMSFWTKEEEERQKLVLVNANLYDLRKAIMGNFVQAAVAHRPDIKYNIDEEAPSDYKEAFDKRYVLVTPENVDQVASQYPKMFKPLGEDDKKKDDGEDQP